MTIPSLPFVPTASLPEVLWVIVAWVVFALTFRAWHRALVARYRAKNVVRMCAAIVSLGLGMVAFLSPPAEHPTWISVLNPLGVSFITFCMGLLSLLEDQARDADSPFTIKERRGE